MDFRSDRLPAPPRLPTSPKNVLLPPAVPSRPPVARDSTVLPPPLPPPASRPLGLHGSRVAAVAVCGALALVAAMAVCVSKATPTKNARVATTVRDAVASSR